MPDYNAGAAVATYDLQTTKFDAASARILATFAKIEAAQARASKAPAFSGPSTSKAALDQERLAQAQQRTAVASNQAAIAAQRLATEQQRTASASTNAARAEQQLAKDTANATAAQERAATAAIRRQQAQSKPSAPAGGGGLSLGGFAAAVPVLGAAAIGSQVVSAGVEAAKSAIALRETQNSLRAVAGDQATYNQVLAVAAQQQRLFGGSLQENIEGLSGLTITARSSGASLNTLIDLTQRLGVLDPAQGAAGARIALNEALAGDPTSLAKRYEIPKAALAKLKDETIPVEERLKVIDTFLNNVGITSASVAGKVDQAALAYRGLSAELGDLATKAGGAAADFFAKPAEGLSRLIGIINGNPEAIAKFQALVSGKGEINQADIDKVAAAQRDSAARSQLTNSQIRPEDLGNKQAGDQLGVDQYQELVAVLAQVQGGTDAAKASASELLNLFVTGQIPVEAMNAGLAALAQQSLGVADTEDRRAAALAGLNAKQQEALAAVNSLAAVTQSAADTSLLDSQAKTTQAAQTELLNFQTQQAAQSFLALNPGIDGSGIASAVAAGKISAAVGQYIAMTLAAQQARNQLAQLQAQAGMSPAVKAAVAANPGDVGRYIGTAVDPRAKQEGADNLARYKQIQAQEKALADAKRDQITATGSAAQKQALFNSELQKATREYGANSVQAIKAKTALDSYTASQEKSGGKGKKPKAEKLSDQQRLNNSLMADQDKFNDQYEDAELTHAKNILKIEKDYQEKSLQQQKANEISKRQSQADFYDRLTSSDLNKTTGKGKKADQGALAAINADYQAAFAKSQELAQAGNAKLAADYLALKQKQAESELTFAERVSAARGKKDTGEVTRLTAIQNLRRQAGSEEEKQLLEGGDQNVKARDEAIANESLRYEEAQGKIADNADRAAERKILAAQRAGKAIDDENAKLVTQNALYAGQAGGAALSSGAPKPTAAPSPADGKAVAPPTTADMWQVSDAALLGAVQAQTAMQEGKYNTMIDRLGAIERAVSGLRGGFAA